MSDFRFLCTECFGVMFYNESDELECSQCGSSSYVRQGLDYELDIFGLEPDCD